MDSVPQCSDATGRSPGPISSEKEKASRNALENALTHGLMPLARSWRQALDHELMSLGLSGSTGWTLLLIDQLGDHVRQTDLASGLDINSASVVRLVDALVEAGFVSRALDPIGRRVRRGRLTEAGRGIACKVECAMATFRRQCLAGLSDEDLGAAVGVSREIGRTLQAGRRL